MDGSEQEATICNININILQPVLQFNMSFVLTDSVCIFVLVQMLAKWAEDDRQEKIKADQRRQKMLEYRQLCNQLDVERHKQLVAGKVSSVTHPFSF